MKNLFQNRFIRVIIYSFVVVFIFVALMNYIVMPWYVSETEVSVPKVQGLKLLDAINLIEDKDLNYVVGDTTFDRKHPSGTIVLQKPFPGELVKAGRTVFLVLSGGEPLVVVPQLRGKSIRDVKLALDRVGLKMGEVLEVQSNNPKDVIVDQQYAAGTKIKSGKTVSISISLGSAEGTIEVPALIGKSFTDAEKILHENLLRVGKVNYQPSFSVLPNTVIDQYPSSGNKLNENDAVDLFITKNVETSDEVEPK
jgi:serine/threonine-protein kinase